MSKALKLARLTSERLRLSLVKRIDMNAETTCIDCCEAIELDRNKTEWVHLSRLREFLCRIIIVGAEDMSKIK